MHAAPMLTLVGAWIWCWTATAGSGAVLRLPTSISLRRWAGFFFFSSETEEGEVVLCEATLLPSLSIRLPSRHAQLGADLDRAQAWVVLQDLSHMELSVACQESRARLPRGLPATGSIRSGQ